MTIRGKEDPWTIDTIQQPRIHLEEQVRHYGTGDWEGAIMSVLTMYFFHLYTCMFTLRTQILQSFSSAEPIPTRTVHEEKEAWALNLFDILWNFFLYLIYCILLLVQNCCSINKYLTLFKRLLEMPSSYTASDAVFWDCSSSASRL